MSTFTLCVCVCEINLNLHANYPHKTVVFLSSGERLSSRAVNYV